MKVNDSGGLWTPSERCDLCEERGSLGDSHRGRGLALLWGGPSVDFQDALHPRFAVTLNRAREPEPSFTGRYKPEGGGCARLQAKDFKTGCLEVHLDVGYCHCQTPQRLGLELMGDLAPVDQGDSDHLSGSDADYGRPKCELHHLNLDGPRGSRGGQEPKHERNDKRRR